MSSSPLSVVFLWHMHQPYYKDPFSGVYRLPWVRLHGTKDYLDMVTVLEGFPDIRQTFNLVPSLLEQIIDYTDKGAKDAFLEVTLKEASELTDDEKVFILRNFFLANWDTMVRPFPRYHELLEKRGLRFSEADLRRGIKYFTQAEFLDLQVLFNLIWIDPVFRRDDPFLSHLAAKGKEFTEEEKRLLIEKQFSLLRAIVPKYRELSQKGQIEISTSPFYHPILPLLCDTGIAKDPVPDVRLPKRRFAHPEDAQRQIGMAVEYYEMLFGSKPRGMWPSEGAVSEEVVGAFREAGIQWIATDEDILSRSLGQGLRGASGNVLKPEVLYSAYEHAGVSMIFRDHRMSDLLGFVYAGWDPKSAAGDLIGRLLEVQSSLPKGGPYVVPIILDGENAWEYYRNDATEFFLYLYEGLSKNDRLKTATVSGFLRLQEKKRTLEHVAAGSWIYANFNVWIGHEEDNTSWDYLTETRDALESYQESHPGENLEAAWKSLYVAEGSDWNWWYGDDHSTALAEEFDELYRMNLMKVYREIGRDIPAQLHIPVLREDRAVAPALEIRGFIHPKIDGIMTSYFEWYQGAHIDVGKSGGSMHMTEGLVSNIYYGFDLERLYVRVDPKVSFAAFPPGSVLSVEIIRPLSFRVDFPVQKGANGKLLVKKEEGWAEAGEITEVALDEIFECAIPFRVIGAKERDELSLFISVAKEGEQLERCPWRGYIGVTAPTPDFEAIMWS